MTQPATTSKGGTGGAVEFAGRLRAKFLDLISEPSEFRGEVSMRVADPEKIAEVCDFAKAELGFDYLVDVSSLENYGDDPRFTIVYHLYGYGHGKYLRLKD